MDDNSIDLEKGPTYSATTLVHPGYEARDSHLTLASVTDSISTLNEKRDSFDTWTPAGDKLAELAAAHIEAKAKLAPIVEQSSIQVTPRLSTDDVDAAVEEDLPAKSGTASSRWLRWNFFSYYRRLFSLVFIGNMIALIILLTRPNDPTVEGFAGITYLSTTTAAAINLVVALLARNEHFVNTLFLLAVSVPLSAPLWLRARVAKIYCYGGLHSGCGVAAVMWYIVFSGLIARHIAIVPHVQPAIAVLTFAILTLLLLITIFAHPALRQKYHNSFENTHRLAGWTIIGVFWAQVVLTAHYASTQSSSAADTGTQLLHTPAFWCLLMITSLVIYPWLRLRSRVVHAEQLSPHAIRLHFDHAMPTYCMGVRVTDSPLRETHAFATIPYRIDEDASSSPPPPPPDTDGEPKHNSPVTTTTTATSNPRPGFSILISRAGDWTTKTILTPPSHLYFRGYPTLGVLRIGTLFHSLVLVTTGSGIGPCLSLLNGYAHAPQRGRPKLNVRVIWSTPEPLKTYGRGIVEEVMKADEGARIIDTRNLGEGVKGGRAVATKKDKNGRLRPDLVKETWQAVQETGAEAVVVIANPAVTREVVFEMEARGVKAFGPIWDS